MTATLTAPTRPALRYFGGKFRLAPWIESHLPTHACYCEPYAGAASILFCKRPAEIEVLNDINSEVVNFFKVLRERPQDLIRAIELTPFSREEADLAHRPSGDPLEDARRFYVRGHQLRGGPVAPWRTGWRFVRSVSDSHRANSARDWCDTSALWAIADRLKGVFIEHDDALAVIRRYDAPETLFLCDPPYLPSTRKGSWAGHAYRHEADEDHHRALAAVLRDIEGMAIVCGYPSPLYGELFPGWRTVTRSARPDTVSGDRTECLWISPAADAGRAQGRLF